MDYPYVFSVIMAVYNTGCYLCEAIDSVVSQDIGFGYVQLILIDDGSTDESGMICDEYASKWPNNIVVIHQKNAGVAVARNAGLRLAEGQFINFMDSDDKLTSNTFSSVYSFFKENEGETQVVTIPIEFFDGCSGQHWQNEKFNKGDRVIYLLKEYTAPLMFVNASFFKLELKDEIVFDPSLVCGEDIKIMLKVLINKFTFGVVCTCKYLYRRRRSGEESLIQSAKKKKGWYIEYFTNLVDWSYNYYMGALGYFPLFVQYELACDLQWRYTQSYEREMEYVLKPNEQKQYVTMLKRALSYIEDKIILEQKMLWPEQKCKMLEHKHNSKPSLVEMGEDVAIQYDNRFAACEGSFETLIEFVEIADSKALIEGRLRIVGIEEEEKVEVFFRVNGKEEIKCTPVLRPETVDYRFGEPLFRSVGFKGAIFFNEECKQYNIEIVCRFSGMSIVEHCLKYGKFVSATNQLEASYYIENTWKLTCKYNKIEIRKSRRFEKLRSEIPLLLELWQKNQLGMRKAVCARAVYSVLKAFKHESIWILSDRVNKADDNGEAFFEFLCKARIKGIKVYFVISRSCLDYRRLKKIGKVLPHFSFRHKIMHLLADKIVSSQADHYVTDPFSGYSAAYRDILASKDFIFLHS